MEGDEEIVRAESILGGRKKRAYISSPASKRRTKTYYANPRYKQRHLSSWNYEIVTEIIKNVCIFR